MSRRAVVLAGGKGTRLRPYTVVLPKPLMPVGEYPILEVIIKQLARAGFDRITLAVNHQAELIKAFFGEGAKWGVKVDCSLEDLPLGTMGPLKLIADLPENFLVMNGDILTDLDFAAFHDAHVGAGRLFSIASRRREQTIDYGVLEVGADGRLTDFREKPTYTHQVSMGVYILSRRVVEFVPRNRPYGFDNLMLDLIAARESVSVTPFEGFWFDIGRPDDYAEAIEVFEKQQATFLGGR